MTGPPRTLHRAEPISPVTVDDAEDRSDSRLVDRLVRAAQARDGAAFARLYEAYAGRVYATALRVCSDATLAEELTQEVFVRAWDALPAFRHESGFGTWLHAIGLRVMATRLRADARYRHRVRPEEEIDRYATDARRAFPETRIDLERAIAALPPRARLVLVLHDIEGYRHTEIAERLGIAEGTVKAQLHRARALLRRELEQ